MSSQKHLSPRSAEPPGGRPVTGLLASLRGAILLGSILLLSGCASAPPPWLGEDELRAAIRARGLDPETIIVPFELGPEEKEWLAQEVPEVSSERAQLELLLERLSDDDGRAIFYRRGFTGTARETFAFGAANCLGFMNLFIGMARELDVLAYYVLVEDQPLYNKEGDLIIASDHVAAGFGPRRDMLLLDFNRDTPAFYQDLRVLTDLEALAKYYSNRGAEMLQEGRGKEAREWLEIAVQLEPGLAPSWVNLGVARRRTGRLDEAEEAYRTALELDPTTSSAYQNLAGLLRIRGRGEEADNLLEVLRKLGSNNPYSYLSLGDWSRAAGRLDDARRFYHRALNLAPETAELYAALGQVDLADGRLRKARRWLRRALELDATDPRTIELGQRLGRRVTDPG